MTILSVSGKKNLYAQLEPAPQLRSLIWKHPNYHDPFPKQKRNYFFEPEPWGLDDVESLPLAVVNHFADLELLLVWTQDTHIVTVLHVLHSFCSCWLILGVALVSLSLRWDELGTFSTEQKTIDSDASCETLRDLSHYKIEILSVSGLFIARTFMLEYYSVSGDFLGFAAMLQNSPHLCADVFFLHDRLVSISQTLRLSTTCAQLLQSFFIDAKIAYHNYFDLDVVLDNFDADWGTFYTETTLVMTSRSSLRWHFHSYQTWI